MKQQRRYITVRKIAATIAIAALITGVAATKAEAVTRMPHKCADAYAPRLCAIHYHHHAVNELRVKMGLRKRGYGRVAERHPARRDRILIYWTKTHKRVKHRYHRWKVSPMAWYYSSGAQCVHGKEGGWPENNGNGYYGGFQYDIGTWLAAGGGRYAPRADLATPLEQIIITRQKVHDDGWGAWPNTARECGLL